MIYSYINFHTDFSYSSIELRLINDVNINNLNNSINQIFRVPNWKLKSCREKWLINYMKLWKYFIFIASDNRRLFVHRTFFSFSLQRAVCPVPNKLRGTNWSSEESWLTANWRTSDSSTIEAFAFVCRWVITFVEISLSVATRFKKKNKT